jgi:adenylate kinase
MPELVARLSGRRVCSRCQAPFHTTVRPPKVAGVCDYCGGPVTRRADDEPAAVHARLVGYVQATAQVADYYARQNLLVTIDASSEPEAVLWKTLEQLATLGFDVPTYGPQHVSAVEPP